MPPIVQISKIQVRHGKAAQVPQLSGGEFGWAIDSQDLYIGNGAVADGAPEVGNTKVLTEHDPLSDYANYFYGSESTYFRTLQERLDDRIAVESFGVTTTGEPDDNSDNLQRAINELYLSDNPTLTPLYFGPGEYRFSRKINVPTHAILIGNGKNNTVLTSHDIDDGMFVTKTYGSTETNGVVISDMTIKAQKTDVTSDDFRACLSLSDCHNSLFNNLTISGNDETKDAVVFDSALTSTSTQNQNVFINCTVEKASTGLLIKDGVNHNIFEYCTFVDLTDQGMVFISGAKHNVVKNCRFTRISGIGFNVTEGTYNISKNNRYTDVGDMMSSTTEIISLVNPTNASIDDHFDRHADHYSVETPILSGFGTLSQQHYMQLPTDTIQLPLKSMNQIYEIDYIYTESQSSGHSEFRKGRITISITYDGEDGTVEAATDSYVDHSSVTGSETVGEFDDSSFFKYQLTDNTDSDDRLRITIADDPDQADWAPADNASGITFWYKMNVTTLSGT